MKNIIAKLEQVIETKSNYITPARLQVAEADLKEYAIKHSMVLIKEED